MPDERISDTLRRRLSAGSIQIRHVVPRKSGESVLMNPTRQKIFQYLCKYPCRHIRSVERDIGLKLPSVVWHLRILERKGFLESTTFKRRKVYYPSGLIEKTDVPVFALLENSNIRQICALILDKNTISQKEIYGRIGTYQQKIQWYLNQLRTMGIIDIRKVGRFTLYSSTGKLEKISTSCRALWDSFKTELLKKLKDDGVAPKLIRDDMKGIIIQLDTGQKKFNLKIEKI